MKQSKDILGIILIILFPVALVFSVEVNQAGNFETLYQLITENILVMFFNVIFVGIFYLFIALIFKRFWISSLILSILGFGFSCVEYYRYLATGVHFTFFDFSVVTNMSDVMTYTKIEVKPIMVGVFLFLAIYILGMKLCNVKLSLDRKNQIPSICMVGIVISTFMFSSEMAYNIFDTFEIKHGGINNTFVLKEKFAKNGMTAFLVENMVDFIKTTTVIEPQNLDVTANNIINTEINTNQDMEEVPNVIVVMSESYTDFREFEKLDILDKYYVGFDAFADDGFCGTTAVSTFGGFTIKSEFELLMGLPIKSFNSTSTPQNIIGDNLDKDFATVPKYFKSLGYATTYIHPYTKTFYNRYEMYSHYSFDDMFFDENFSEKDYFGSYISDEATFNLALEQINNSDKPQYVHITTMQNHMPYTEDEGKSEIENYLTRLEETSNALLDLKEKLESIDEPTVILFVGDHFPSMNDEGNVYDILDIDDKNSSVLYEQKYFVWNNYDKDFHMKEDLISLFYLPYLIADEIGLPDNQIKKKIVEQSKKYPVYTKEIEDSKSNEILDVLAYEIIFSDLSEKIYNK